MKSTDPSVLFAGGDIQDSFHGVYRSDDPADSNRFTSVVVFLLFVPFGIYFGLVFVAFVMECHQFLLAWNLIVRQRAYEIRHTDDEDHQIYDDPKGEEIIRQHLDISTYCGKAALCNSALCCSICLADFQHEDQVASIRQCYCSGNLFHSECLMRWLSKKSSCPFCRFELPPPPAQNKRESITASLEMASLRVEHIFVNALGYFGEFISSFS